MQPKNTLHTSDTAASFAEKCFREHLQGSRGRELTDEQHQAVRNKLFAAMEKLIPAAMRQAQAGKPALLRLLVRATRR